MIRSERRIEPSWIDAEVVLERSLATSDGLDILQELLATAAPRWASKLRLWRSPRDQRPIDIVKPGALRNAVLAAAAERGATYHMLVERYGRPPAERLSGSAELRGASSELVLVVSVDEWVAHPLGTKISLGNRIALQVRHRSVERRDRANWTRETFEMLCARLAPAWGSACHPDEYWAKVMSESPRIEAVGRDFGRFLPGLFWLNFFGPRYQELIGEKRLRSAPADRVVGLDHGVILSLAAEPESWSSSEYALTEGKVRRHLGPAFFFAKSDRQRETVAPDWRVGP
jgi:hypothetical protein